jgi:hypothetical protein
MLNGFECVKKEIKAEGDKVSIHVEVVSNAYTWDRTVGEVLVSVSYPRSKPKSINDAIQLSDEIFDSLKKAIQNYLNFSSRYMTRTIPFSIDVDRPPRVLYATFYEAGVSLTGIPMVNTSIEFKYVVELHTFSYYANIVEDYQIKKEPVMELRAYHAGNKGTLDAVVVDIAHMFINSNIRNLIEKLQNLTPIRIPYELGVFPPAKPQHIITLQNTINVIENLFRETEKRVIQICNQLSPTK